MRGAKHYASLTAAMFLTISLWGCSNGSASKNALQTPLPTVRTVTASRRTILQSLTVNGILTALPNEETTIVPQVSGTLQEMFIHVGESVVKGSLVAQVASTVPFNEVAQASATLAQNEAQLEQARASAMEETESTRLAILQAQSAVRAAEATLAADRSTLAGDEAALTNAQENLARQQTLNGEGLVSQKDLEAAHLTVQTAQSTADAQTKQIESQNQTIDGLQQALQATKTGTLMNDVKEKDVLIAQQQVENAKAALTIAKTQAALYSIRAPIGGQVLSVGASTGESVDDTTKLATIVNIATLQLTVAVPGSDSEFIQPGQSFTFRTDGAGNKLYTARITSVSDQIDPTTGTEAAIAEVRNSGLLLKENTTVQAVVAGGQRMDAVALPQSAVMNDADTGSRTVAIVDSDDTLHLVPVTAGATVDGMTEVLSGVRSGERVAVDGQYGIDDGTKVKATADDSEANGP